jgi:5-methyltetrahydropteroyltriglutamate--homocysteine methyltransferase
MASRADVVGSLLRPDYLREARKAAREGRLSAAELHPVEDRAVREAIALQESAGLDVITDGELRRGSWVVTIPLREEAIPHAPLAGFEFLPADAGWWSLWKEAGRAQGAGVDGAARPFVTKPLTVVRDVISEEYAFLKANARARTKFTIPAPSWHRIFWHPEYSRAAYPTPEDFLRAVAVYLRTHVVEKIIAMGGDYVQLDAPNYAQWHVDPDNRAAFESWGHDMAKELVADAELDNEVFAGVRGITRAIHVCRGNAPGGRWLANGGYETIAPAVFPRLTNYNAFTPGIRHTKSRRLRPVEGSAPRHGGRARPADDKAGALEAADAVEMRVLEASKTVGRERLAISPQCGFASGEAGNPLTPAEQEAKLRRIAEVARKIWPA